jgi:ADP-ribosylation factor related protein 1
MMITIFKKQTLVNTLKCLTDRTPIPPAYKCFSTLGMNVEKFSLGGRTSLTCWDLGGETGFRSVWEKYYKEAHIVLFVLDATNDARLPEIDIELGAFSEVGFWLTIYRACNFKM